MVKTIQANFNTESEAEHVRSMLNAYDTKMLEVSEMGDGNYRLNVPLAAGASASNPGIMSDGAGSFLGMGIIGDRDPVGEDYHPCYVLSANVQETDFEAIVKLIHDNNGRLEI